MVDLKSALSQMSDDLQTTKVCVCMGVCVLLSVYVWGGVYVCVSVCS